jgi:putative transposase
LIYVNMKHQIFQSTLPHGERPWESKDGKGDSDFVEKVLSQASEQMERRYRLKVQGWTLTKITGRVAEIFGIEKDQVVIAGKQPDRVRARSVLAYWAIRDLGLTATEVGHYLWLSKSAVSRAVPEAKN